MYQLLCIFCRSMIHTPYFDEAEEHVMKCRENALPERRGDLAAFPRAGTKPLTCEEEAFRKQAERAQRGGNQGP